MDTVIISLVNVCTCKSDFAFFKSQCGFTYLVVAYGDFFFNIVQPESMILFFHVNGNKVPTS